MKSTGNNENKYRQIIFDLDGTLLDTGEGVISSVSYMMKQIGFPELSVDEKKRFIGPPIKKHLMEAYGADEQFAEHAMDIFRSHYGEGDLYIASEYPGMRYCLEILKRKYILSVATYKREDQAVLLLKKYGLSDYFDSIHGSDKQCSLTKADIINSAIKKWEIPLSEIVMIGDSDNDAIGAESAGISFIGVTYGYGFKKTDDVAVYRNIGYAESAEALLRLLDRS